MCKRIVALLLVVVLFAGVSAFGTTKDSAAFVGTSFEGDAVPTAAAVPWDLGNAPNGPESQWASSNGSVLNIHTDVAGPVSGNRVAWYLPGAEAGALVKTAYPTHDQHWPGPSDPLAVNNPWNPNIDIGYTVEARIKVNSTNSDTYGFSMYFTEGTTNPYGGVSYLLDFFTDGVYAALGHYPALYEGDMTADYHTVRIVRYAGRLDYAVGPPYVGPKIEVYVDNTLVRTAGYADGFYQNTGGNSLGAPEDFIFMGTAVGAGGSNVYNVDLDYLRCDFTGAYTPVPEPATMALLAFGAVATLIRRKK